MNDTKQMSPSQPAAGTPTAEQIFEALRTLPAAERAKAEAMTGFPLPEIRESETVGERKFGVRCPACGGVGLEFLGPDDPIGKRYEATRWVQDKGIHKTASMLRHRPICQHCASCVGEGVIRAKHRVEIATYSKFKSDQAGRK